MKLRRVLIGLIALGVVTATMLTTGNFVVAAPGINNQIPFTGTLKDSSGNALSGTYDMVFRIYDASTGGTTLWTGTHTSGNGNAVTVDSGTFQVLLGSGSGNTLSLDFNDDTYWLGITIEADSEMTPRTRLGSAPYAFNADTVDGFDAGDFIQASTTGRITAASASSLLTITQNGAGNIIDLYDGGSLVFSVADGGLATFDSMYNQGEYYDVDNSAGTSGYVLLSTGTSTRWVATSTLGISGSNPFGASIDESELNIAGGPVDGYVLQASSTSAGGFAWVATSTLNIAGSSQWTTSGSNIYYSSGNVGISTTTPNYDLVVDGNFQLTNGFFDVNNSIGSSNYILRSTGSAVEWVATSTLFTEHPWTSGGGLIYTLTDSVGIGTSTPGSALVVDGDFELTGGFYDNNATRGVSGYVLQTTGAGVQWVSTSSLNIASGATTLGSLSDVNTTNAAAGDILMFTGSAWATTSTSTLLTATELNTEAKLESLLGDVTNVFTNNDTNVSLLGQSINLSNEVIGTLDIASTSLTVSATGLTYTGGDIDLAGGYAIPLIASTTEWAAAYATTSGDFFVRNTGDTMTGALTMSGANILLNGNWLSGDGANEGVFVDSAGEVGIGTNNPLDTLHVAGNILFNNTQAIRGRNNSGTANTLMAYDSSNNLQIGTGIGGHLLLNGNSYQQFQVGGSEYMRLNSSGNLGINDTTPDYKLEVVGTAANGFFGVSSSTDGDLLSVATSGNVGIGDASPAYLLTVGNGDLFGVNGSGMIATQSVSTTSLMAGGTLSNGYVLAASSTAAGGFAWYATSSPYLNLASGGGTVTSVGLSAPTGFTVSGSPVTNSGTLTFAYDAGYGPILTASTTEWATAFGWGDHSAAGYLDTVSATGLEKSGSAVALTAGYTIPLSASTTEWNNFYQTPSSRITGGDALTWSGNTLNLDINGLTSRTGFSSGDELVIYEAGVGIRKIDYDDLPGAGGGLTSLNSQTGSTQTFATSTSGGIDLVITSAGDVHTFTANPTSGYAIPLSASTTEWNSFYQTPSGVISAGTGLSWAGNTLNAEVQSSDLANYFTLASWYATDTDALAEGSTNQYFTNARVASYINGSSTILNDATESGLESFLTGVTNVFTNNDTIGVANGGTGATTFGTGQLLVGNGTGAVTATTTAGLKESMSLDLVENTALSTWGGSSNITTLGTITSGTWNSAIQDGLIVEADLNLNAPSDGYVLAASSSAAGGFAWYATSSPYLNLNPTAHDAVTLAGSLDYITLSGQVLTRNAIDLATDTTGTLASTSLAAEILVASELNTEAKLESLLGDVTNVFTNNDTNVSLLGQSINLSNEVIGTLDIASTSLTVSATGLTYTGGDIDLAGGYIIPLSASTTNWNSFYQTPSGVISAGTGLSWAGNTLNAEVQSSDLANYFTLASWYATTTDGLDEGSTNQYFTNARVASYINGSSTILNDATESGLESFLTGVTNVFTNNDTIGVANGGTGATTFGTGQLLVGNGTGAVTATTTAGLKESMSLDLVENTALSTWGGSSNIVTVGALDAGSITANFGNIDIGSSNLDADGTITFAGLSDGIIQAKNGVLSASTTISSSAIQDAFVLNTGDTMTGALTMSGANILLNGNWLSGDGGNEGVFVDNSGQVGIGTSSPASKLDVWGDFRVGTSGTPTLFADVSTGRVGIGTTSPRYPLEVNGNAKVGYLYVDDGSATFPSLTFAGDEGISGLYRPGTGEMGIVANSSEVIRLTSTGKVGIGTTTPTSLLTLESKNLNGTGTVGVTQFYTTANTNEDAVQFGNSSYLNITGNTATTTVLANIVRVEDGTTLGNDVRGFEVQTNRGGNTQGLNTAMSGFARTFGVYGYTSADAGNTLEPAGGFFELGGSGTQGNALRAYSNKILTSELVSLFQEDTAFEGTGLLMNFGNDVGGSFSSTTSKFVDFQNAGTSYFTVSAYGTTTIGNGNTQQQAGLQIGNGGLCVDNDGSCNASTTGRITADELTTSNSDLAEMYFSSDNLLPGELVVSDSFLSIKRATPNTEDRILGVVSTKPGLTIGSDDHSLIPNQKGYPLALTGRVPVRLSNENGDIMVGDPLTLSSIPGVAMKATEADTIVGYALEAFNGTKAYTEGFVNQFGDDLAAPDYSAINVNKEANSVNPCHFGGLAVAEEGAEDCDPNDVDEDLVDNILSEQEIAQARYEAEQAALQALLDEPAGTEYADGEMVKVGQVIMFVERGVHLLTKQTDVLNELTSTDLELVLGAEEGSDETLWDRLKDLAQNFVDGVLKVAGIETTIVYTRDLEAENVKADTLCLGNTCVDEDELKALLLKNPSTKNNSSVSDSNGTADNSGEVVDDTETESNNGEDNVSSEQESNDTDGETTDPVEEDPENTDPEDSSDVPTGDEEVEEETSEDTASEEVVDTENETVDDAATEDAVEEGTVEEGQNGSTAEDPAQDAAESEVVVEEEVTEESVNEEPIVEVDTTVEE